MTYLCKHPLTKEVCGREYFFRSIGWTFVSIDQDAWPGLRLGKMPPPDLGIEWLRIPVSEISFEDFASSVPRYQRGGACDGFALVPDPDGELVYVEDVITFLADARKAPTKERRCVGCGAAAAPNTEPPGCIGFPLCKGTTRQEQGKAKE